MRLLLALLVVPALLIGCGQPVPVEAAEFEGVWVADYDPEMQQLLDDSHGVIKLQLEILPGNEYRLTSSAGDSEMVNTGSIDYVSEGMILRNAENPEREIRVEIQERGARLYLPSIRTGFVRATR